VQEIAKAAQAVTRSAHVTDEDVEAGYRKCLAEAGNNVQKLLALELERKGGQCPICDVPFKRVEVRNQFATFDYFEPGCYCYKKCPVCSIPDQLDEDGRVVRSGVPRFMVAERLLEVHQCIRCYREPAKKEVQKTGPRHARPDRAQRTSKYD